MTLTMKRLTKMVRVAALLALLSGAAFAETKPTPTLAPPGPDGLLIMIRSHVLAAGQAVTADNFEVLRSMASAEFRAKNSNDDLRKAFAELAARKLDLAPLSVLTPILTDPPGLTADGHLRLVGAFPSKPVEIPFGLTFAPVEGAWKLSGLSLGARPPSAESAAIPLAAAPAKPADATATKATAKPSSTPDKKASAK